MNRLKYLLTRVWAALPGTRGRRAIYDRLGRIEGRTLELQIQLARRLEILEKRLAAESDKTATHNDLILKLVSESATRDIKHHRSVEEALARWVAQTNGAPAREEPRPRLTASKSRNSAGEAPGLKRLRKTPAKTSK